MNALKSIYFSLFFLLLASASCNLVNPEEPIPSYLKVTEINLETDANKNEGTDSHNITDAWVYVDDNLFGVFELPVELPLLEKGTHNIKIFSGIKNNGQSSTRVRYPYYRTLDVDVNLQVGETNTELNYPATTYYDNLFFWNDDFESPGFKFNVHSTSDTIMDRTTDPLKVFEGNGSGIIHMDANHPYFQCVTDENFSFPTNGIKTYLELNFKTNNTLRTGVYKEYAGQSSRQTIAFLSPTDGVWKKIYIELTEGTSLQATGTKFELFFEAVRDEALNPEILIDNVKLVHFQ